MENWSAISNGLRMAAMNGIPTRFDPPVFCPWCGRRNDGSVNDAPFKPLLAAMGRLLVGVTGKSTPLCEWYEGILADATAECESALAEIYGAKKETSAS
jgi:hypothetical protein